MVAALHSQIKSHTNGPRRSALDYIALYHNKARRLFDVFNNYFVKNAIIKKRRLLLNTLKMF